MQATAVPPVTPEPMRPPLKWAGGKRWLVPHLRPLWERYRDRRLVEPLCGGLAVSLGLMPKRALLNDVNPHNVNFFRWLKAGLVIEIEMANDERLYYAARREFNRIIEQTGIRNQEPGTGNWEPGGSTKQPATSNRGLAKARRGRTNGALAKAAESDGAVSRASGAESKRAAELFYYLNRTGYNGLCRFNRRGEFNVPFGRHATINYGRDFRAYRQALSAWEFTVGDFEAIDLGPDDFIYADPPYDVEFRQYTKEGFAWEGQVRLAEWLARHPGPVVLSNQATPRIMRLYEGLGFDLRLEKAPRMISCNGDRTKAVEVIATRNLDA